MTIQAFIWLLPPFFSFWLYRKKKPTPGTQEAQERTLHCAHLLRCWRWRNDWWEMNSEWSSPPLETSNPSISSSLSPSSVSMFAGDRLSAILNSIQSGPFLSAAPSSSVFEQAAQPPSSSSSSLVHSPFVFGQSPSQLSQPQPQLLSKSVLLSDSAWLHRCWSVFSQLLSFFWLVLCSFCYSAKISFTSQRAFY